MRRAWKSGAIAAVVILSALVLLWRETHQARISENARPSASSPGERDLAAGDPRHAPRSDEPAGSDQASPRATSQRPPELAPHAPRSGAPPSEAIDPCTPVEDVEIPHGFEATTVGGVTIAWKPDAPGSPSDTPVRPILLAHLVTGALEDVAELTGTAARGKLTVFVYPSARDFHADADASAPAWASGTYDGAVRLFRDASSDAGVRVSVLRHEIVHAQLHAAIGCMPAWFNEGVASYVSSELPIGGLFAMLRDRELLDVSSALVHSLATLGKSDAGRAYWQSVAMVEYAIEHAEGGTLAAAVRRLGELGADPAVRLAAWQRWFAGVDQHAVLDAYARHVFGGAVNVDEVLRGPICCWGLRDFAQLGCRAAAPHDGVEPWLDKTKPPPAMCKTAW